MKLPLYIDNGHIVDQEGYEVREIGSTTSLGLKDCEEIIKRVSNYEKLAESNEILRKKVEYYKDLSKTSVDVWFKQINKCKELKDENEEIKWVIEIMQQLNIENSMNSNYNLAKLQRQNRELTDMLKDCYDKLLDKDNYADDMKFNLFMCKLSNLINESEGV